MAEVKTVQASVKGLSLAPRKVSLVAGLIRHRSIEDALVILEHTPKRAAKPLAKLLESAKANAKTNHGMDDKTLQIDRLEVAAGPALKRFRPAAMGRAWPYSKKTSHVKVVVSGQVKPKKKPANKSTATSKSKTATKQKETA